MIYSIDPTTEKIIAEYEEYSDEKIIQVIESAEEVKPIATVR